MEFYTKLNWNRNKKLFKAKKNNQKHLSKQLGKIMQKSSFKSITILKLIILLLLLDQYMYATCYGKGIKRIQLVQ